MQDDTQPPADPPAQGGGGRGGQNQQGKREVAWRPDGQGLTFLEQEPAPAGQGGRANRGQDRGGLAADDQPAEGQRGQRPPERKDRLYQWTAPFDDASRKVIFENSTRMTGHRFSPDMKMLFASERRGRTQRSGETPRRSSSSSPWHSISRRRNTRWRAIALTMCIPTPDR